VSIAAVLCRRRYSGGEIDVVCRYRTTWSNEFQRPRNQLSGVARPSLYMQAEAIDIRLAGIPTSELRDAALRLDRGGVGTIVAPTLCTSTLAVCVPLPWNARSGTSEVRIYSPRDLLLNRRQPLTICRRLGDGSRARERGAEQLGNPLRRSHGRIL